MSAIDLQGELRDDAFDLDALVLRDLPFAAYYPAAEVLAPPEPPPLVGAWPGLVRRRLVGHGVGVAPAAEGSGHGRIRLMARGVALVSAASGRGSAEVYDDEEEEFLTVLLPELGDGSVLLVVE